ncbi:malectin domain-containing carbohydrate-binding protein [Persicobacter diffluens]|uniref:HYR domain-containing protein n=1 Tax=Persicobacter diffluens TaxID=981 RepID=A0AAN4VZR3_9BACT|nr:hypothetical protein PEDI_32900 [Persicobacter diffluens]
MKQHYNRTRLRFILTFFLLVIGSFVFQNYATAQIIIYGKYIPDCPLDKDSERITSANPCSLPLTTDNVANGYEGGWLVANWFGINPDQIDIYKDGSLINPGDYAAELICVDPGNISAIGTTWNIAIYDIQKDVEYKFFLKDNGTGAESEDSFLYDIPEPFEALDGFPNSFDPTCPGGNDGSINIQATGGTGQLTYTIYKNGQQVDSNTTGSFTDLTAGTYSLEIKDAKDCIDPLGLEVELIDPAPVSPPTCPGPNTICLKDNASPTLGDAFNIGSNQEVFLTDDPSGSPLSSSYDISTEGSYTFYVFNYEDRTPSAGGADVRCYSASCSFTVYVVGDVVAGKKSDGMVCNDEGEFELSSLLTSATTGGGSWSQVSGGIYPASDGAVDFTDETAGDYVFKYSVSNDCGVASVEVTVSVKDAPEAGDDNSASFCLGTAEVGAIDLTALLANADGGGAWTDEDNNPVASPASLDLSTADAGEYKFTYTITADAPCEDDAAVMTITILDEPSAGDNGMADICNAGTSTIIDLSAQLLNADEGGVWTDTDNSGVDLGDETSVDFKDISAGTYVFTYTVGGGNTGCNEDAAEIELTVYDLKSAGENGELKLCVGDEMSYTLFDYLTGDRDTGGKWFDSSDNELGDDTYARSFGAEADGTTLTFTYKQASNGPCEATEATLTVIIEQPAAPASPSDVEVCDGDPATLTATGTNIVWYDSEFNGTELATGNTYEAGVRPVGMYTFYIAEVTDGCESLRSPAKLIVKPKPAAPQITNQRICEGDAIPTFEIDGTTEGIWKDLLSGTSEQGINYSPAVSEPGTYFFEVIAIIDGCPSEPATFSLIIDPKPVIDPIADIEVCVGEQIKTNITGTGIASFEWEKTAGDLVLISSTSGDIDEEATTAGMATIKVTALSEEECPADPVYFNIKVNPLPDAPGDELICICPGEEGALDLPDNVKWVRRDGDNAEVGIDQSMGMGSISAFYGVPNNTGAVIEAKYDLIAISDDGCESAPGTLTVQIKPTPDKPSVADKTICEGEATPTFVASGEDQATFKWYNHKWEYLASGAEYTPTDSEPGTYEYFVKQITEFDCPSEPQKAVLTIKPTPEAPVAADLEICEGEDIPYFMVENEDAFDEGTITWYEADPAQGIVPQKGTGMQFMAETDGPGTYTCYFTRTINGCEGPAAAVTLTIHPKPMKPSQENIIVCEGETVPELIFGNGVYWEKISFTGEIGLDDDNHEKAPKKLPSFLAKNGTDGELSNTIRLVKVNEFGCESEPHTFKIIVQPTPAAPIAYGDAVCFDDQPGKLTATSGDSRFEDGDLIFNWYDAEGGQLLAQSTEFVPEDGLPAGTYSYFVTASRAYGNKGKVCEGPGVEVDYTIFPKPAKPVVEDLHYCSGEEVHPYKLGFGKPGTFVWEFKDGMNSIGMSENSGENYLPKFTAINTSDASVTNTIKVKVIDENGCVSNYAQFDITIHPAPKVSLLMSENPGCNGDADGTASFFVYGGSPKDGNPSYDWNWNGYAGDVSTMSDDSGMTFDADHLAGSIQYTLEVTDKYGCMAEADVTLKNPSNLDVEIEEIKEILCFGDMNGELTAIIDGGTYNEQHDGCIFIWTHVESSTTFGGPVWSGLGAGTYWLTIIDENGCTADAVYKLKQPDLLEITDIATTDVTCYGAADGTATITAIGGTLFDYGDYRYSLEGTDWLDNEVSRDPQKSNVFVNLAAGSYKVTVEDKNGCIAMEDFIIEQPTEVEFVSCEIVDVTCPENLDGSITVTAQGGTPGYTYSIDGENFQASNLFEYLGKGAYDVFVKDANGCTAKKEVTIGVQPDEIDPEFDYKPADTMVACGDDISPDNTGMATATDNCEGVEVTYEDQTEKGECPAFEVIIRTWTATDYYGNKVSCEQRIEIKDEEKPYFTKLPEDKMMNWGDDLDPIEGEVTAADDCSGLKHLCFEDGDYHYIDCETAEFERKWIAIDTCDNKEFAYQTITLKGQRPLHLTCPEDIVVYAERGDNGAFVDFQETVSTTNTGLMVTYSHRSGDYFPTGETEVTITAKDDCGNRKECRFTIEVKDTPRENGAIYINANGKEIVTTKKGLVFDYDKYYRGGTGYAHPEKEIYQTDNDKIHLTERYGRNFSYAIPAQTGQHYKVTLFFSENYHNYANKRKFSVALEGEEVLEDFDIFAEAGGKCIGITREFQVYADDEYLNLAFYCGPNGLDNAKVDGICVMPIDGEEVLGYYVNAKGERDYTTEEGYIFKRDAYYSGGATYKVAETTEIEGTNDDYLYTTERYGRDFSYRMPAKAGQYYQVKLFFAEVYHREAGKRIFNVDIDGENKLYGYDIVGKAGARYRAVCETFEVYAQADHMNIRFYKGDNGVDMAKVSAICIVPIDKPEEPVYTYYVNAHGTEVYESYDGYIFGEDQYFYGGKTYYASGSQIDNSYDDELFRSERYGENFLYRIPARHGKEYEVKLFFAETYWNEAGSRTFHVDIEGQRKLELFDIFAEAGGKNKAVCKTFYVTADGNALDIEFYVDGYCADNAKISAICVMPKDEAPENAREVDLPSIVAPETIVGNLKAYPNPAAEYFNLNVLVEEQDQFEVQLIDMTGVIHNIKGDSIERLEDEVKVFIEDMKLVGGTYMVRYNHNGINSEFLKLMVK